MSKSYKSSGAAPFVQGAGCYYVISWIFTFYPAFIITFALQRLFFGLEGEGGAAIFAILGMIILTFIILGLIKCKQYFIVLMVYLLTTWPFLYILKHCWDNAGEMTTFPLPLDFWALW